MAHVITGVATDFNPNTAYTVTVPSDGDPLNAASVENNSTTPQTGFQRLANAVEYLRLSTVDPFWGDGVDGVGVADGATPVTGCVLAGGNYTAARDLFFSSLTIDQCIFSMAGYRLYVNGTLTLTSHIATILSASGLTSTSQTGGLGGGNNASNRGAIGSASGADGGNGGNVTTVGASTSLTVAIGGAGGNGGAGAGIGAGGGGASVTTAAVNSAGSLRLPMSKNSGILFGASGASTVQSGSGGGGGGGGAGAAGGGGGGSGAVLLVCARAINLGAAAQILATGGSGAAGQGATGGGGGGGAGGAIVFTYNTNAGSIAPATISSVAKGHGGAAGAGASAGSDGTDGVVYVWQT